MIRRLVFWFACFASIAMLLAQTYGLAPMSYTATRLMLPAALVMAAVWLWAIRARDAGLLLRLRAGLLGGMWGTIGYDLVRVPFHLAGQNPFVPIRGYGVWIAGAATSSPATDLVGLAYHASNGVTFAWIYAIVALRRHWGWAVAWGLALESLAVFSAFGEVFAIRHAYGALILAYAAHVFYGYPLGRACRQPERLLASMRPVLGTARGWMTILAAVWFAIWFLTAWQSPGSAAPADPPAPAGTIRVGPTALHPGWTERTVGSEITLENRLDREADLRVRRPGRPAREAMVVRLAPGERRAIPLPDRGIHQVLITNAPWRSVFVGVRDGADYRPANRPGPATP
jgi:hypothetical protein